MEKSVDSVDGEDSSFITSKEDGKFEYPLNNRKIVHNQEIEVSSSSLDDLGEDDEEVEEDSTENLKLKKKVQVLKLLTQHRDMKKRMKYRKND